MIYVREIKEMEEYILSDWFDKHKASIAKYDGVTILDWKEPGTSLYSVRYIFAGSKLYISGDIGNAIFDLTWEATPESFDDVNLSYFLGKLSCNSRDRWQFDERKAVVDLNDWYEEMSYDANGKCLKELKEVKNKVRKIIDNVSTQKELELQLFDYYANNMFHYFDGEDFSMFSNFGKRLPNVFVAYLLGIKTANKQLKITT